MPTTLFWIIVAASLVFGFVFIGGGMKWYMSRNDTEPTGGTSSRQSKGAQQDER